MSKIYGSLVVRNEEDRYLRPCIKWASSFLDGIFVYDDASIDNTAQIAADLGCRTVRRGDSLPSFIEHEGQFRSAAWSVFEQVMQPASGDWVLSFDADEFLVSHHEETDYRQVLDKAVYKANNSSCMSIIIPFLEVFKIDDGKVFYRTDGLWGKIQGSRLFRYERGGAWSPKAMGCGSEPTYVKRGPFSDYTGGLSMMHLGYAKDSDKQSKYERYSSLGDHGHNDSHIKSIITPPTLVEFEGDLSPVKSLL